MLWFTCDEEIAQIIKLINHCGTTTINSCQDNRLTGATSPGCGGDPAEGLLRSSGCSTADEAGDRRKASPPDSARTVPNRDFERSRLALHARDERVNGELAPLTISIRFPYTDLPEVVARLRSAALEIDGTLVTQAADDSPPPESGSPGDGGEG